MDGFSVTDISITSLRHKSSDIILNVSNDSLLLMSNEQINRYANIREQLIMIINNFSIHTPDDIKFQTTNQLTRKTSV
ncbi:hypothetical protein I4U23_020183 [Adineta vaga]|nr:hypothetical protein I4U23_020183 [Adineta vaga]